MRVWVASEQGKPLGVLVKLLGMFITCIGRRDPVKYVGDDYGVPESPPT